MNNRLVKIISGTALALTAMLTVLTFAPAESNAQVGGRIEGTWNVRVTLRNCQTQAETRSFDSITMFMSGGTLIDSTSGVPQALKTPGQGVWSHTTGQNYQFAFKSFTFDASGNYTGYTIIRHGATLDPRGTAYESAGKLEVYAPNGTLVFTGCSTTTATRFE